ncbi:MAG TPA: hypothetical protein VJA27_03900 [Patescibacteria group bacterium]|nr:hypothetical protein [Patescibacteria group bacterium]
MNLFFRYKLWKARHSFSPTRIFKRELLHHLQSLYPADTRRASFRYQLIGFRMGIATVAGLMVIGSIGTTTYAYASPAVAEGTVLYPLKQQIETIEERWYRTPEQKAKFYLRQIERREAERKVLRQKTQRTAKTEERIETLEERLITIEQNLKKNQDEKIQRAVRERLEKRKQRLEQERSRGKDSK